ncbi:MAG: AAA family ATPase, partial [Opitutaceae bacterium]|nr:AAA family ATPase [Opitutaceae bacterium]
MKFLVIRGLPGSGRSTLAQQLAQGGMVLSLDQYLKQPPPGSDIFTSGHIGYAWAELYQAVAAQVAAATPRIIVETISVHLWEVRDLWRLAEAAGYAVDAAEPQTPWARDPKRCMEKTHLVVSRASMKRLVEDWEGPATRETVEQAMSPEERLQQMRWLASRADSVRTLEEQQNLERFVMENFSRR